MVISVDTEGEIVDFVVSGDTMVVDNVRLRRGMRVAAFYDASLPAPAVFSAPVSGGIGNGSQKWSGGCFEFF